MGAAFFHCYHVQFFRFCQVFFCSFCEAHNPSSTRVRPVGRPWGSVVRE